MAEPLNTQADSSAESPQQQDLARKLPLRKKILFAIIVNVAFFAVLELLLAAVGVTPLTYNQDPFVGFTSRSPLFEEVPSPDGHSLLRTSPKKIQWFNSQSFPARKADGAYRIFCMGGSTTYGRPYDDPTSFCGWLREYLRAADSSRQWEVINAGGISYASYRVAALMEELVEYEPDLFIIYCGQNEFLERRTYGRLISTPRAIRETAGVLAQSRVYASVHKLLHRSGGSEVGGSTGATKLPAEVDAILDGSVGPDDYQRDDEQRSRTIDHYRFNLARMIEIARSVGAQVLLVIPAVNERNMSPFKSQHGDISPDALARFNALIAEAGGARESGNLEGALQALNQALEIDPLFADAHFARGEVLYELHRFPDAKRAFQRAIDEDVCPLRMLSEMRPAIVEVAAAQGVPVVDFQQLLESKTESGITGEEWFLDHVHPTIDGYRELALQLFDELATEGIAKPDADWTADARAEVESAVMARVDDRAHGIALRNLGKVLSWARKYEEAGRLAQLASSKLADDAEVHCMAGYDFERQGQLELAKQSYEKAIELRPNYAHALYNLGHVHRRLQEWELAIRSFERAIEADPRYPGAHYNLGLLYADANRLNLAAQCFETSTTVNEKHPGSWEELGNVRLRQGKIDEAMRHLKHAIELDPNLASAYNSLGVAYAQLGRIPEAIESFERALAISPKFDSALQNLQRARRSVE